MKDLRFILGSSSKSRLSLLESIGIVPDQIMHADIDETPLKNEIPKNLASRLSKKKIKKLSSQVSDGLILTADTVAAAGRKILPKALNSKDIEFCLNNISGRRHNIYTSISVIKKINNLVVYENSRISKATIQLKRLSREEIEYYSNLDEGLNKAGGYSISGKIQLFIKSISGSPSTIIGLPLLETRNMLLSAGFDIIK